MSFVFGLEVTWDLLQVQLEEEAEGKRKQRNLCFMHGRAIDQVPGGGCCLSHTFDCVDIGTRGLPACGLQVF